MSPRAATVEPTTPVGGLVFASIAAQTGALIILDAGRRLYAGISRGDDYWHVVSPSQVDQIDLDGNVVRAAGFLACICKGFIFHGRCYRSEQAEAFEAGQADQAAMPRWAGDYDAPVGAGESVEASRG